MQFRYSNFKKEQQKESKVQGKCDIKRAKEQKHKPPQGDGAIEESRLVFFRPETASLCIFQPLHFAATLPANLAVEVGRSGALDKGSGTFTWWRTRGLRKGDVKCGARDDSKQAERWHDMRDVTRQTETIDRWPVGQPSRLRSGAPGRVQQHATHGLVVKVCSEQSSRRGRQIFFL